MSDDTPVGPMTRWAMQRLAELVKPRSAASRSAQEQEIDRLRRENSILRDALSIATATIRDQGDQLVAQRKVNREALQEEMARCGYAAVGLDFAAGVFAVTLWGYDGDYGLEFSRGSLAEAIELAERYLRDVPGPDDIGCAACVQQTREWLRVHDPANDALAAMEEKITLIV